MISPDPDGRPRSAGLSALVVLIVALVGPPPEVEAQAPADKAAGLFDDEKPAANTNTNTAKDTARPADPKQPTPGSAGDRDVIGFTQENATSQMTELEERMFRLSEALRGLEPENASRLRLALKFSKEELILEQMRETHNLLKDAELTRAETEVRELVAKLQHLRDVLLAEDLDFQLKLARLRQLRETLNRLDRIVKEERRALGWSRFAIDQRQARDRLNAIKPDLEKLARDVRSVLDATRAPEPDRPAVRERVATVARAAAALAANPLFANFQPSELRKADALLGDALARLDGDDLAAAITAEDQAATVLAAELLGLDDRIAVADRDVAESEFRRHETDQARNRQAAATLGAGSGRLGDAGVPLQKDLIRAGSAMQAAEGKLARSEAAPAVTEQTAALETLGRAADDLARAAEKLLVQLRTELQARLNNELTEMHEAQAVIRETAEAQVPRLALQSRSATIAMAGLAQKEGELATRLEQLLGLVEETEYGIALPTTVRVLGREMRAIEGWLKAADATPRTLAFAHRVEDDLITVVGSVRRLPPTTPPAPGSPLPSDLRERERELNRLIAELKLVRLLQSRLNDDTVDVDQTRSNPSDLTPALKRDVEGLESNQEEIREALARVAQSIQQP